jgi:probable sporulation protein (polysaccharide deacetylase family)
MRNTKWGLMTVCFSLVISLYSWYGPAKAYRMSILEGDHRAAAALSDKPNEKDSVYRSIITEAEKRRIAPVDAVFDRVWKAVPGYNGLEVDVEQTYRLTVNSPLRLPIRFVYREIPPRFGLDDLGAKPIYKGNPNKPMVSLMVNVSWGEAYIKPILDILDRERVKATFFLDGTWLKKNPELAKLIAARGHELSNHAYSHPNMSSLSRQAAYRQIALTENLLKQTLGVNNRWFAPPSGDYNQMTVDVAAELGLKTVLWTVDTVDWTKPSPAWIVSKISRNVEPGSLILLHPTASSRDALPGMIAAIKRKGLTLGTVSDTLSPDRVPPVEREAQF